jgi:hypothetical protein
VGNQVRRLNFIEVRLPFAPLIVRKRRALESERLDFVRESLCDAGIDNVALSALQMVKRTAPLAVNPFFDLNDLLYVAGGPKPDARPPRTTSLGAFIFLSRIQR